MPDDTNALFIHVNFSGFSYRALQECPKIETRQRVWFRNRLSFAEIEKQRSPLDFVWRQIELLFKYYLAGEVPGLLVIAPGMQSSHLADLVRTLERQLPLCREINRDRLQVRTVRRFRHLTN